MFKIGLISLLVAAPLSASTVADPVDNYSASTLQAGRFKRAIQLLEPLAQRAPGDESALLNLAIAYRYTAREADAVAMYHRVLALPDVELDTARGSTIWSHEAARRGLAAGRQISSR